MSVTKDSIVADLRQLGLSRGDTVFVTADLMRVGLSGKRSDLKRQWHWVFEELLGEEGTIVAASYSRSFLRWRKDPAIIYSRHASTTSGSLSKILLDLEQAVRSSHPTNSYVAVGPKAASILGGHNEKTLAYDPIGEVIKVDGKNLMLGTVDETNAPMAMHYAQQIIGDTTTHPLLGVSQSYYFNENNDVKLYTKWDAGGCSAGGRNLYGALVARGAASFGQVGASVSCLIDGRQSLDIALELFERNPSVFRCGRSTCLSCYGRFMRTPLRAVGTYYHIARRVAHEFSRKAKS